ncbi:MAG TPA: lmo0937 family membrane protein [Geothermobacteraceae bacterium]|nr:lmo0937 family membrane protein [Geothermobacteraceae bacterium]
MLWPDSVILMILWALGLVSSSPGGFIRILLVIAIVVMVARFLQGRRAWRRISLGS